MKVADSLKGFLGPKDSPDLILRISALKGSCRPAGRTSLYYEVTVTRIAIQGFVTVRIKYTSDVVNKKNSI